MHHLSAIGLTFWSLEVFSTWILGAVDSFRRLFCLKSKRKRSWVAINVRRERKKKKKEWPKYIKRNIECLTSFSQLEFMVMIRKNITCTINAHISPSQSPCSKHIRLQSLREITNNYLQSFEDDKQHKQKRDWSNFTFPFMWKKKANKTAQGAPTR